MASEQFMSGGGPRYFQMQSEPLPATMSSSFSSRLGSETSWVFEELPKATIVSVSRPDAGDISPMLLSYTIELQYKQARFFKWRLLKKASQVIYLHFALKKRAIIEEFHEKQEQAPNTTISTTIFIVLTGFFVCGCRDVPSSAALPIIRPALGRQQSISDSAKVAMQGYLNHFLGNMDIVNSREVYVKSSPIKMG
ncbi:hypothetical protein HHK36_026413 [Tetracentron sinense]|uniref:Uncharacterized protein n=1 Tax=Tetracentron sinense TaxID=13715 RepID=A0A834YJF8_TETSI|nr:hypothetical protein HHK36_026413 [Tetracentron sinense]